MLHSPVNDVITALQALNKDPELIRRRIQIFKQRELRKLGVASENELTLEQRGEYQAVLDKNIRPQQQKLEQAVERR